MNRLQFVLSSRIMVVLVAHFFFFFFLRVAPTCKLVSFFITVYDSMVSPHFLQCQVEDICCDSNESRITRLKQHTSD